MNVETKNVRNNTSIYESFGWTHTEDVSVRHGKHHYKEHVLVRNKDMPNYVLIEALERKYFALKSKEKHYKPMDPLNVIALFLLFLVPGAIYVGYKSNQKEEIEAYNIDLYRKMKETENEARELQGL